MQDFIHIDDQGKEVALNAVVAQVNSRAKYTAVSSDTPLTLTAANMTGAAMVVVNLTVALGGAGALTTDTAANIIAALTSYKVGETYRLRIMNTSSNNQTWTVGAGSGVTVNGTATIAQNTWREFLVTIASATTVTMQNIGGGNVV